MVVNITYSETVRQRVADSIGSYIFKFLKKETRPYEWISGCTEFYENLKENETINVTASIAEDIRDMITEFVPGEIEDMIEDDMEWLCCITALERSLKTSKSSSTKSTKSESEDVVRDRKPEVKNVVKEDNIMFPEEEYELE